MVRLDTSKNNEGRTFPFDVLPDLASLLKEQQMLTRALEEKTGGRIEYVFHHNGEPIRDYYGAWRSACNRAAKGGKKGKVAKLVLPQLLVRIPHDFRRTAVRNLVRAGVPDSIAMKLTGHKTRSVFDRYDIVNEADLRSGVSLLASHLSAASPKVGDNLGTIDEDREVPVAG